MNYLTFDIMCAVFVLAVFCAVVTFSLIKHRKQAFSAKTRTNNNIINFESGGSGPILSGTLIVNGKRMLLTEMVYGENNKEDTEK